MRHQPPRRLSARSVVLSLMMGMHPPELPVRDLVRVAAGFGVGEGTVRVALTRMLSAGDVVRDATTYRLSARLLERQAAQDADLNPTLTPEWDGSWEFALVTATGRAAEDRAELRTALSRLRLGEVRAGVWARPANLARPRSTLPDATWVVGTPEDDLTAVAFDLTGWANDAHHLIGDLHAATDPADALAVAAAMVRHLRSDPHLPASLCPPDWPAALLRAEYDAYRHRLGALVGEVAHGQ